jgi:hypothetical protein
MGVFSRLAQRCIDNSDRKSLAHVFAIALNLHTNGNAAVLNAINVSFLEHLSFTNGKVARQWAYGEMPPSLCKAFDDMQRYNKRIHGSV